MLLPDDDFVARIAMLFYTLRGGTIMYNAGISWIAVKTIGVSPLSSYLERGNIRWYQYPWDGSPCMAANQDIFHDSDDTLIKGIINDRGATVFFIDAGLRITKSFSTHIVFFFDHHPSDREITDACGTIGEYIESELDKIDLDMIFSRVKSGGSTIN